MKQLLFAATLLAFAPFVQAQSEWTSLFDGKTLTGWTALDGKPIVGWEVQA